jgi:hypothetical protein
MRIELLNQNNGGMMTFDYPDANRTVDEAYIAYCRVKDVGVLPADYAKTIVVGGDAGVVEEFKKRITTKEEIRDAEANERVYAAEQPEEIAVRAGYIGIKHIMVTEDTFAAEFKWSAQAGDLKGPDFDELLEGLTDAFRGNDLLDSFLSSDEQLRIFCMARKGRNILRADVGDYTFMVVCHPDEGAVDIACYQAKQLRRHMDDSRSGIMFMGPTNEADHKYKPLFVLPDGGDIMILDEKLADGRYAGSFYTCRFISGGHMMVGDKIYDRYEFAEMLREKGARALFAAEPEMPW